MQLSIQFKISNDKSEKSKIKIMLLSENQNGGRNKAYKNKFMFRKRKKILPIEKKKLSIEFIGDSITCTYGVEAPDQTYHFTTAKENFSKSYAYLDAKILDADYSAVALSCHGIVSSYSDGDKWAESLMSLYYEKISKNIQYPGDAILKIMYMMLFL